MTARIDPKDYLAIPGVKQARVIGGQVLLQGDCLEIMPTLEKFDAVVTDPPYLLESGGKETGKMGGKFRRGHYDNSGKMVETTIDWSDFMPIIYHALKANSHAYVMCNNRHVKNMLNSAEDAGLKFHNILAWHKGIATPNRWYMKNLEFTGFFYKGEARRINDCGSTQLQNIPSLKNQNHPTAKPVELMKFYIRNSTQRGDNVLDPFMGGGTTLDACQKLGRCGIGIELDSEYFEIACERVIDATRQLVFNI